MGFISLTWITRVAIEFRENGFIVGTSVIARPFFPHVGMVPHSPQQSGSR
jgi:hypothetical protein